ncbi:hypothetical protein GCM10011578_066670 [Streptomyces fuscichromogenes]|uniref:Uncharacterized protein n=1 Tax=Streptomyces fuscichromogenes TaxID=1324013 RepID=A0A917XIU2_9ACTN|nr:hypothetical protein GCM10011578_066670 [Streptomyces fuscichromogenes]
MSPWRSPACGGDTDQGRERWARLHDQLRASHPVLLADPAPPVEEAPADPAVPAGEVLLPISRVDPDPAALACEDNKLQALIRASGLPPAVLLATGHPGTRRRVPGTGTQPAADGRPGYGAGGR